MTDLETERLIFTVYDESLYENFIELFTDEAVMKYVDKGVLSREAADALWSRLEKEFYLKDNQTIWAVVTKEDRRFVGHASLRPRPDNNHETEIGYILTQAEWGKGYATEIARRLIDLGFNEMKLNAVYATVNTANQASIHVLEKCGMNVVRTEYDETGKYYLYGIRR